jgi:hypothetical protein
MQSPPPLQEWLRRPLRYWYVDGLTEMAVGAIFSLLALTELVPGLLPPGPFKSLAQAILQPLVVIGGVLGARPLVRFLKERITYPRTGQVRYRQPGPYRRWLLGSLSFLVALGTAFLVTRIGAAVGKRWLPMASAFLIAFVTALGWQLHLVRMLILAIYILGAGIGVSISAPADPLDAVLFFGLVGLGWLASGGWTLWRYLRHTQPLDAVEDAG